MQWSHHKGLLRWLTAGLLWLMFALALHSLLQKSPTFDEQGFLVRGLGYLRGENRHMRVGHPLGLNALNALLLAGDEQVRLPVDDPSWAESSFHRPAELFLWEIGNDVERVMFLGRLPTVWLGMLLAALAGRWAAQMSGRQWAGVAAVALLALDPNILAHTRLATTDLGLTAGATVAGYTVWRFGRRPGWETAITAGVGQGLLQNTKFTALLFVPLFALLLGTAWWVRWRQTELRGKYWLWVLLIPLAGLLTLWAAYGFDVGTLSQELPLLGQLAGRTVPLAHHLEQALDIGGRTQRTTASFLLGQHSEDGWWYYFPVTFLLKTPLPVLLLLLWTVVRLVRRQARLSVWDAAALWIPAVGFFAIAMTTNVNIGYRHILPVLPFLYVFAAVAVAGVSVTGRGTRLTHLAPVGLLLWLAVATLWISPHFLAFFNVLAGGPDNGWRALVDSNLDWGQDLGALAVWQQENNTGTIWLSYFGEGRPDYYGLDYRGLDSYPPRLMNPQARPFYPHDPAPGLYAISATNLQGVLFANHDQFAWFREREPLARIGHSIFVYQVERRGPAAELALGGVQLDEIAAEDYAILGTNDITPHWFDPRQGLLVPAGESSWLVTAGDTEAFAELTAGISSPVVTGSNYTLYQFSPTTLEYIAEEVQGWSERPEILFTNNNATAGVQLIAAQTAGALIPGGMLEVQTAWRQEHEPRPVKVFLHLVDEQEQIVTQWDGLAALWEGWRPGDWLLMQHTLDIPPELPAGTYQLFVGVYEVDTLQRWQTTAGEERILLGRWQVEG